VAFVSDSSAQSQSTLIEDASRSAHPCEQAAAAAGQQLSALEAADAGELRVKRAPHISVVTKQFIRLSVATTPGT